MDGKTARPGVADRTGHRPDLTDEWRERLRARRKKVWTNLLDLECDTGLVYGSIEHPAAFRYLTDYTPVLGDMWGVITGPNEMACVLTFHWGLDEARERSGLASWYGEFDPLPRVMELLASSAAERVGILGWDRLPASATLRITQRFPGLTLLDADEVYLALRRRKDPLEIGFLAEAAAITETALEATVCSLAPGVAEHEVSARLAYEIFRRGGGLAFSPMALIGGENPVIYRRPTDRSLRSGDVVMIDVGAEFEGYQADIARTFVFGSPTETQQRAYEVVSEAHEAILSVARPGVPCDMLHQAGADVLKTAGYEVLHRMGHGVGLATSYEWPSLDTEDALLKPGMTLAIEPAVYPAGVGSLKLEDMIVITDNGYSFLSHAPRGLRIIRKGGTDWK